MRSARASAAPTITAPSGASRRRRAFQFRPRPDVCRRGRRTSSKSLIIRRIRPWARRPAVRMTGARSGSEGRARSAARSELAGSRKRSDAPSSLFSRAASSAIGVSEQTWSWRRQPRDHAHSVHRRAVADDGRTVGDDGRLGKEPMRLSSTGPESTLPTSCSCRREEAATSSRPLPAARARPTCGTGHDVPGGAENTMTTCAPQLPWAAGGLGPSTPTEVDVLVAENDKLRAAITPQWAERCGRCTTSSGRSRCSSTTRRTSPTTSATARRGPPAAASELGPGKIGHSVFSEAPVDGGAADGARAGGARGVRPAQPSVAGRHALRGRRDVRTREDHQPDRRRPRGKVRAAQFWCAIPRPPTHPQVDVRRDVHRLALRYDARRRAGGIERERAVRGVAERRVEPRQLVLPRIRRRRLRGGRGRPRHVRVAAGHEHARQHRGQLRLLHDRARGGRPVDCRHPLGVRLVWCFACPLFNADAVDPTSTRGSPRSKWSRRWRRRAMCCSSRRAGSTASSICRSVAAAAASPRLHLSADLERHERHNGAGHATASCAAAAMEVRRRTRRLATRMRRRRRRSSATTARRRPLLAALAATIQAAPRIARAEEKAAASRRRARAVECTIVENDDRVISETPHTQSYTTVETARPYGPHMSDGDQSEVLGFQHQSPKQWGTIALRLSLKASHSAENTRSSD